MGRFTKDREYGRRLDAEMELGRLFVLYALEPDGESLTIPSTGEVVERAVLTVQHLNQDTLAPVGPRLEVKTIAGPIVAMAGEEPEEGELPAIVKLEKVTVKRWANQALVIRYISPFEPAYE